MILLEIQAGGETEIFVKRPRVAINATVFAAAIRIQARAEANIRAVIVADDGLAVVLEKLRPWQHIVVRIPIFIRFKLNLLKPVRRIFRRAAMGRNHFLHEHGPILAQEKYRCEENEFKGRQD
jgi:hypothetical protein